MDKPNILIASALQEIKFDFAKNCLLDPHIHVVLDQKLQNYPTDKRTASSNKINSDTTETTMFNVYITQYPLGWFTNINQPVRGLGLTL